LACWAGDASSMYFPSTLPIAFNKRFSFIDQNLLSPIVVLVRFGSAAKTSSPFLLDDAANGRLFSFSNYLTNPISKELDEEQQINMERVVYVKQIF